jgi:hypothetical protein
VAFEDAKLGVMEQAVEGGAGEERIVEERRPFLERAVRRDDQRAARPRSTCAPKRAAMSL